MYEKPSYYLTVIENRGEIHYALHYVELPHGISMEVLFETDSEFLDPDDNSNRIKLRPSLVIKLPTIMDDETEFCLEDRLMIN